jgi:hypothetical protein
MTKKTLDLDAAAQALGISKEALRKRIKRGSIEAKKNKAGRWQVIIDDSIKDKGQDGAQDASSPLIEQLKSENAFLRQQLHQQSIIIYNLSESVKLLEGPKDRRPFWKRIFKRNRE